MIESLGYILLAILGLGFLVFIHELGHFIVARRQGMRVEAFSIGFGKPLYSWEKNGVKWIIGMLPFGGYVKIAGMSKEGKLEPHQIPDGFFGKTPWQRIQVALAGPLVNIGFALLVFAFLWFSGGREKNFAEFTHRIGWVSPDSALYAQGIRPGDVIKKCDGRPFQGVKDLLIASLMKDKVTQVEGYKIDFPTGKRTDFDYALNPSENAGKDSLPNLKAIQPASYLIYDDENKSSFSTPPKGMEPGDRIIWADGDVIFSVTQLSALTNESTAFLTVQRGTEIFHTKVPRTHVYDLKMSASEKAEIGDWQHEASLQGRLQDLFYIPYNLSPLCQVESSLSFIDEEDRLRTSNQCERCSYFSSLQEGDQILAIDGKPVQTAYDFLAELQTRHVLVIVQRDPLATSQVLWTKADEQFAQFGLTDLNNILNHLGADSPLESSGNLHLLEAIVPKTFVDALSSEKQEIVNTQLANERKEIEKIQDPYKKEIALKQLEASQKRLVLGVSLHDRQVIYNPSPIEQFKIILSDTWRTLVGLFSGHINPKYMSGPVGIVHVVHQSWMIGVKEALFWMAVISLNLGVVNLLPIPVLDGGHISFALLEMATKRPLKAKTMERLVIPFIGLLVGFFIYITYQDLARLFSSFF
jgi:regulator of sigma E protease